MEETDPIAHAYNPLCHTLMAMSLPRCTDLSGSQT